jgi:nudix-type nucleoside diphosphatase (YffH/AdpP family)
MTDVFVAGPLSRAPLLDLILGAPAVVRAARLAGFRLAALVDGAVGHLTAAAAEVEGVILTLPAPDLARLDHAMRATGATASTTITVDGQTAQIWTAEAEAPDWDAAIWQADFAPILTDALPDLMADAGRTAPGALFRRLPMILVRSASRLRAATAAPHSLRHAFQPENVALAARRQPYANFFSVEEYDLSFRRFDGSMGPKVNRAAFISGDAVTVLPYDPVRDRVLLVEQFRTGPFARGDANPFSLEAIAGRIDAGETPEQAGRREAVEEAGLTLGALLRVADYYASPGAKTEFLYSFVAIADLPDGAAGIFGVEGEAEDIRGHLIGFDHMMALIADGEVNNAPLILSALWLQRERPRLRAAISPR